MQQWKSNYILYNPYIPIAHGFSVKALNPSLSLATALVTFLVNCPCRFLVSHHYSELTPFSAYIPFAFFLFYIFSYTFCSLIVLRLQALLFI